VLKIAKEANVSPSTIYVFFNNKEDLLVSTYLEIKHNLADALGHELEVVAEPMKYREIEYDSTQSKHRKDKGQDQDHERNNGTNHIHAL